jgi:hypothetical protein
MRTASALFFLLAASLDARAVCTPQMVAELQMRGASPPLVAQICGAPGPAFGPMPASSVCATNLGVCPYRGPMNMPCTCFGPMGAVPGVAR